MNTPAPEPLVLDRVTTEYLAREDRLRLTGRTAAGGTLVIWLTQRLLIRLLTPLFQLLEQAGGGSTAAPNPVQVELRQSFAQQAARAALTPLPAVRPASATQTWVARSVSVGRTAAGVVLVFQGGDGQQARLPMAVAALRQWLNILYDVWRRAEWRTDLWPAWITDAAPAQGRGASLVLH